MNNSNNNNLETKPIEKSHVSIFNIEFENDKPVISARELHKQVGSTERFASWFDRQLQFGFEEYEDFTSVKSFTVVNNGAKRELDDYHLTVDMAKQICMIQKNEKAKLIRKYLIEIEKLWNSPEQILARAMKILQSQNEQLQSDLNQAVIKIEAHENTIKNQQSLIKEKDSQIDNMKPKADKFDTFMESKGSVEYKVAAKALGTTRNKMLAFLRDKQVVNQDNTPRSYPYNKGYLIVKVSNVNNHIVSTTYVTATGIEYLYRLLNKHQTAYTSMYDPNFIPRPYEEFKEIVEELFEENE